MIRAFLLILIVLLSTASNVLSEELVIISPHWEGLRYEFEAGFAKWRESKGKTPVAIIWRDVGGTSEIVRFVQSEFQGKSKEGSLNDTKGIGIDLIFGGGIDPFVTFKKQGLLERVEIDPEIISHVSSQVSGLPLYDPDYFWFAPTMSAFGIFCNQKALKTQKIESPERWEDLLRPELKSWIASADPRRSGTAHMFYEIILQTYGWERGWQMIFSLAENFRTFLASSPQVILDVVNAEVACGFAIDSQANSQLKNNKLGDFTFVVPTSGSLFNGDGIAILKSAPNYNAAKDFIEYSLSTAGQSLLYLSKGSPGGPAKYELNRLPVLPKLFDQVELQNLNPFIKKEEFQLKFDSDLSARRWEMINDMLAVFIIEAKDAGTLEINTCREIIPSAKQAEVLIDSAIWTDPIKRNQLISEWKDSSYNCGSNTSIWIKAFPFVGLLLIVLYLTIKRLR